MQLRGYRCATQQLRDARARSSVTLKMVSLLVSNTVRWPGTFLKASAFEERLVWWEVATAQRMSAYLAAAATTPRSAAMVWCATREFRVWCGCCVPVAGCNIGKRGCALRRTWRVCTKSCSTGSDCPLPPNDYVGDNGIDAGNARRETGTCREDTKLCTADSFSEWSWAPYCAVGKGILLPLSLSL